MRAPVNCLTTRKPGLPRALRQRGQALLLALLVLGVAGGAALFSYYRPATLTLESDQKTTDALAHAKAALIGYAISRGGISGADRPGEFPCPDFNAPATPQFYGIENGACGGTGVALGRVPWKTLGIPEPKDAAGETLWYAVATPFRRNQLGSGVINSDTRGNITVFAADGLTPLTTEAVAVIFAPGPALGGQTRGGANQTIAANYLETSSGINNADTVAPTGPFIVGRLRDPGNPTYNDRVLYITTPEFIPAVEMRVGIELKNALSSSQLYPWAAYLNINIVNAANPSYSNPSVPREKRGRFPSDAELPGLPSWFTYNNWHNVIYYGVATLAAETLLSPTCTVATVATCTLSVDGTPGVAALFFTPGTPPVAIVRPSNTLANYLEIVGAVVVPQNNDHGDDLYVTPARTTATPLDRDRITIFKGSFTSSPPNCNQTATALIALAPCAQTGANDINPKCAALVANLTVCSCFSSGLQMITMGCRNNLNPPFCQKAVVALQACNS